MASRAARQAFGVWLAVLVVAALGCDFQTKPAGPEIVERPFQDVELKLAIVADPETAAAVRRMQGDWSLATGAKLTLVEVENAAALPAEYDVVVASPGEIAALVAAKKLKPIEETLLDRPDLAWYDVFEQVRQGECRVGLNAYALPLGTRSLVLYVRSECLSLAKGAPPKSWEDYQQLLAKAKEARAAQPPAAGATDAARPFSPHAYEPLAPGWAGLTLLTRAAAYAKDRGHYSALFNVDDMGPLIATAPFIRALDELKAAVPPKEEFDVLTATPDDVREAFLAGRCAMALAWPAREAKTAEPASGDDAEGAPVASAKRLPSEEFSIESIPGSLDVYNLSTRAWQTRKRDDGLSVPLVGSVGRLAAVNAGAKNYDAAFELAAALVGGRWGQVIRRASRQSGPCRRTDQSEAQAWIVDPAERGVATQYVDVVASQLSSPDRLDALRIPGRERYLAALDAAVHKVVKGEADSKAALTEAAFEWEKITTELGRPAQAAAYRASVGYE